MSNRASDWREKFRTENPNSEKVSKYELGQNKRNK